MTGWPVSGASWWPIPPCLSALLRALAELGWQLHQELLHALHVQPSVTA